MEEAPENDKESSHSARANVMNEWFSAIPFTAFSKTHIQPFANLQPTRQQILKLQIPCNG